MKKLVVFSGAGMSAESGISTFRTNGGIWENYNIEDVATPQAWKKDPDLVTDFYNERRKQIMEVEPSLAHTLVAQLQERYDLKVVTQNIDDLHERAGCKDVLHLHGNIMYAKSSGPSQDKLYPVLYWCLTKNDKCDEGHRLRPHVVWFGESVPMLDIAAEIIGEADVFIVIGTSLNVYPAAGLIHAAVNAKEKVIIDPNVDQMDIPADFESIKKGAAVGLELWQKKEAP